MTEYERLYRRAQAFHDGGHNGVLRFDYRPSGAFMHCDATSCRALQHLFGPGYAPMWDSDAKVWVKRTADEEESSHLS